jgi:hypothetical protein
MKSIKNIVAILLIVAGILMFAYQSLTYTKTEKIAQVGDVQVTADEQKTVYFPPVLGGLAIVAGIILLVVRRK